MGLIAAYLFTCNVLSKITDSIKCVRCEKIEKNMLRWFGHVERMDERRFMRQMWMVKLEGAGNLGEHFLTKLRKF
jgi:hypothetical protein